jgi:CRISPR/Cas system Type II protein with McrA/HNH and RuvC-like nuclease domain
VGITGVLRKGHLRVDTGDTGESLARPRRPARSKRS